jgi:hypothetical protein
MEWQGQRAQYAQRRAISRELAGKLSTIREMLLLELRLQDALAAATVRDRIKVDRAMFDAGLITASDVLKTSLSLDWSPDTRGRRPGGEVGTTESVDSRSSGSVRTGRDKEKPTAPSNSTRDPR